MQKAVPVGVGAMAALLGLEFDAAAAVAAEAAQGQVCQAANDNGGGQVVLAGAKLAVERAVEIAKSHGVKRAMMLPVSAPFHCALMQPAQARLKADLDAPSRVRVSGLAGRLVLGPGQRRDRLGADQGRGGAHRTGRGARNLEVQPARPLDRQRPVAAHSRAWAPLQPPPRPGV